MLAYILESLQAGDMSLTGLFTLNVHLFISLRL